MGLSFGLPRQTGVYGQVVDTLADFLAANFDGIDNIDALG